jgi:hypothetical protein
MSSLDDRAYKRLISVWLSRYLEDPHTLPKLTEWLKTPDGQLAQKLAMSRDKILLQRCEPPSLFRPPVFMVGRDRQGNWVVRDQKANAGGLFVTRDAALRYVRSQCGYQPRVVTMVSGNFELDISRSAGR